jgi:hypothetical protein
MVALIHRSLRLFVSIEREARREVKALGRVLVVTAPLQRLQDFIPIKILVRQPTRSYML